MSGQANKMNEQESLEDLSDVLVRLSDAFTQSNSRPPKRLDIESDANWNQIYLKQKENEFKQAQSLHLKGYCNRYIPRRRRFCASRAADNCDGFCTEHFLLSTATNANTTHSESPLIATNSVDNNNDHISVIPASTSISSSSNHDSTNTITNDKWRLKSNITRRMKKMTNPLAIQYTHPIPVPDWGSIYADPTKPFLVDLGKIFTLYVLCVLYLLLLYITNTIWHYIHIHILP